MLQFRFKGRGLGIFFLPVPAALPISRRNMALFIIIRCASMIGLSSGVVTPGEILFIAGDPGIELPSTAFFLTLLVLDLLIADLSDLLMIFLVFI